MRFPGFIGPSYTLSSVNYDCQRTVNLYPEADESGRGKEGEVAMLRSTPGLRKVIDSLAGPIRCIHVDPVGRVFIAAANKMYKATYSSGTWSATEIGTLLTTNGIIRADSSVLAYDPDENQTVFVDGTINYLFWAYVSGTPQEEFGTFTDFGYPGVPEATHIAFIDGYWVYNMTGTGKFAISGLGLLSVSALDFATAEGDPDNLVGLIASARDLWLFGERTTEVFNNTGNADFPFGRVSGGFIEQGCAAPGSIAKIGGNIFWLGRDKFGQGIIFTLRGLTPQRISTHAIETAINGYADLTAAVAFTYQSSGHGFYVINFAEGSWCYDINTGMWHERLYTNAGVLERYRGQVHAFIPQYGVHLVGDYELGKVYQFDDNYYYDDTTEITRMRTTPHVTAGLVPVAHRKLQIDMQTGVGLDGAVASNLERPQAMLDFSDDGGHTFSSEMFADIGAIGAFRTRVIWRRLGISRDRVYRFKITDPVPVAIIGAEIDVEKGVA